MADPTGSVAVDGALGTACDPWRMWGEDIAEIPMWRVYFRDESVELIEWLSSLGRYAKLCIRKSISTSFLL